MSTKSYGQARLLTNKHFYCWLLLLVATPHAVLAQDTDAGSAEESVDSALAALDTPVAESDSDDTIDEITVLGTRSLRTMQRQIKRADETLFGLFNELNTDDNYDVYCRDENRVGSKIKIRVCKSNFERGVTPEEWEDAVSSDISSTFELPKAELRRHREAMRQEMIRLVVEHPELMKALDRRTALQQAYDLERQERRN